MAENIFMEESICDRQLILSTVDPYLCGDPFYSASDVFERFEREPLQNEALAV